MKFLTFQNLGLGFVAIMFALFGLSILTTPAKADVDSRPIQVRVMDTVRIIQENQLRKAKLQAVVDEYNVIILDNKILLERLKSFGKGFDWAKNEAVDLSF